jgi:Glutathione-dependent formaldehyde-activating enzyme
MTTRHGACSCGQLHLTIEGESARISMCHCLACQRRTGAAFSNQARFRREQVAFTGKATTWNRTAESGNVVTFRLLSDMRLHGLPGERKLSWIRHCCRRKLRRPEFPRADCLGVGGVTPPLGRIAARHFVQANGEAGVTTSPSEVRLGSTGDIATSGII